MSRSIIVCVVLSRLSLVFLAATLGISLRWIAYIGDVVRTQDYYDFAAPLLPTPQITRTYTYTIFATPTTVTYTNTDTQTFSVTSYGSSVGQLTTYTHTGTYVETYSSGQYYQSYYSTRYGTETTFTPSVATIAAPTCRDGCTGAPVVTQTLTSTPTQRGTLVTPSPTTTRTPDLARQTLVRNAVADAKHRSIGALVCLSLLLAGLLWHSLVIIVLLQRAGSPAILQQLFQRNASLHDGDARALSMLRWAACLFVLFTAWNVAAGIAMLVFVSPPSRFQESFIVFAVFFSLMGAACVGTIVSGILAAWPRVQDDEDAYNGSVQHATRNEKQVDHDHVVSPEL